MKNYQYFLDSLGLLLLYSKNETIGLWKLKYVINTLDSNLFKYLKKLRQALFRISLCSHLDHLTLIKSIKFNFAFKKSTKGFDLFFEKFTLKSLVLCRFRFRRADPASV